MTFNSSSMIHLTLSKSRSSTCSSCAFHELAPSLLSPSEGLSEDPSKQYAGRRLSKIRTKLSDTMSKSTSPLSAIQASHHTQTLPSSRPHMRRALSRSMIAPLQQLFSGDHHTSEVEIPERYEAAAWSLGLAKSCTTLFSRKIAPPPLPRRNTCDDEDWDFRCQGMAPIIPARPSEDEISPTFDFNHSFLGSPGFPREGSFGTSSASSCYSSPISHNPPLRATPTENSVKKQKISIDSISGPLNLWGTSPTLLLPPPSHHVGNRQLGLDLHP